MQFWTPTLVPTLLSLGLLLGLGQLGRRVLPLPAAILAGGLGLLLGPSVLDWLPLDQGVLETGVYHALGIIFICLGLQPQAEGPRGQAVPMAFGISVMVTLQTLVGLGIAMALGVHAGFGLLLPLGFEQGPGQALALGSSWEASGMPEGGQVGLILAAIGFLWAVIGGVPLVHFGRRLGLAGPGGEQARPIVQPAPAAGETTRVLSAVAVLYGATWWVCGTVADLLASAPEIAAMVWGFHFLVGALLATATRAVLDAFGAEDALDPGALTQISGTAVDGATVAALSAVQLGVLTAWWLPIVLISTVGGLVTLGACVLLAQLGFRKARFEHAVLWFGMSTGTLPIGLALLQSVDPELSSSAPSSAVYGSALSILGVAPVVLFLHPLAITGGAREALALTVVWLVVLVATWWRFGGLALPQIQTVRS